MNNTPSALPFDEWSIYDPKHNTMIASRLRDALAQGATQEIVSILQDTKALRGLIIWRGERGTYLHLILNAYAHITGTAPQMLLDATASTLILSRIHDAGIPEDFLLFCAEAAFHLRDKEALEHFVYITTENVTLLHNINVHYKILHALATWKSVVDHNTDDAIALNTEVIAHTKESSDVYYLKAKFGLTHDKSILPKQKVEDFLHLAKAFKEHNDIYDSFRATIEAARALLDLSKQQGVDDIAFNNIEKAKEIALDALKMAKDINYINLEIIASEVLSSIYKERLTKIVLMSEKISQKKSTPRSYKNLYTLRTKTYKNDEKKYQNFIKKAKELRTKYHYLSQSDKHYKDSYYPHARTAHS